MEEHNRQFRMDHNDDNLGWENAEQEIHLQQKKLKDVETDARLLNAET